MEESRFQRENRKVRNYAINYGMSEQQIKDLVRRRKGRVPPAEYLWPDSFPPHYRNTRIQPIPFGELRGTIEN